MEDHTQVPASDPGRELPTAPQAPAAPQSPDPESRRIARGLFAWLLIIAFGGLASVLFGQEEGAFFFALAGVLVLAQATDAAVAVRGYKNWVESNVPRREFRGVLFRVLVRSLVPMIGVLFYAGIGAWALSDGGGALPAHELAAWWCFGSALVCALLVWRPAADLVTRACFRTGAIGRTRRLTARVVVMALLLPVPMRLLFPEMLDLLKSSEEPLATPGGLVAQLVGEVVIAVAGVGLLVRRDWRQTLERLGITAMKPVHFLVAAAGLGAIIALNSGMEWMQQRWFHELWLQDTEVTKLIAADLPVATTLLLGLSAGLGEEISLRGALQPRLGIVLTAIVFASLHVQYSWVGMLTIALLGALLGVIRARTNTTTAILIHALYDVFAALSSH
ncbi:MAG: CPBP family intramembrane metalloprotease [Candidatus Eisenbacteria bacterium]|uniref:CPBP family intramembrane metalloprotease n=1 Tax=Eiseniibacteriota bacterium TaxID=2212470 RepID=A0A933SFL8_UNCEI|nr:CPBP family intramembrane metalloprotease [Candidatus Eisenbacteria bacterium]